MALFRNIAKNMNSFSCLKGYLPHFNGEYTLRAISTSSLSYQHSFSNYRPAMRNHDIFRQGTNPVSDYITMKRFQDFLLKLRGAGEMSSSEALFLLRSSGEALIFENCKQRQKLTHDVWKLITEFDVAVDVSHFNSLLQANIDNECKVDIHEFLNLMKARNIKPNRVTFTKLIDSFCQFGNIEGANKILEMMNEEKHAIDKWVFNSLIIGNSKAKDLDGALQVIEIMKQKELIFSRSTYDCLVQLYSENNKFMEVKETIAEAEKNGIIVSSKALFDSFANFAIFNNKEAAKKMYSMLPDLQTGKVMVPVLTKLISSGECDTALDIIQFSHKIDLFYRHFLHLLINMTTLSTTTKFCKKMMMDGVLINPYDTVIMELLKKKSVNGAVDVLYASRLEQIQISPDVIMSIIFSFDSTKPDYLGNIIKVLKLGSKSKLNSKAFKDIISKIDLSNPKNLLKQMNSHLPYFTRYINQAIFLSLLEANRIEEAVDILIGTGGFQFMFPWINKILSRAFCDNADKPEEFAQIIALLNIYLMENRTDMGLQVFLDHIDLELARGNFPNKEDIVTNLLKALEPFGLNINEYFVNQMKLKYSCLSAEAKELLDNMTKASPTDKYTEIHSLAKEAELLKDIKYIPKKLVYGKNINGVHKFYNAFADKNYHAAEEIYKTFVSPASFQMKQMIAKIYQLQNRPKDVVNEVSSLLKLNEDEPSYSTLLLYVESLLLLGRVDEALTVINAKLPTDVRQSLSMKLAIGIAELPDSENADAIRKIFIKGDINIKKVDIYKDIKSNNLEKALEEIKAIYNSHELFFWKNEFYMQCIETEQSEMLQRLHDFVIMKKGKTYALQDLAICFLIKKKLNQAAHVFQTLGNHSNGTFLNKWITLFALEVGKEECLEDLLKVTADCPFLDRSNLYHKNILTMIQRGEADKALEFWTDMQNENLQLSDNLAMKFSHFLTERGIEVPFVIPTKHSVMFSRNPGIHQSLPMPPMVQISRMKSLSVDNSNYIINHLNADNFIDIYSIISTKSFTVTSFLLNKFLGKAEQLNKVEEFINATAKTSIQLLPTKSYLNMLLKTFQTMPQIVEPVENSASISHNPLLLVALWNHYMMDGRKEDADLIFQKCKHSKFFIILHQLSNKCYLEGSVDSLEEYINQIEEPSRSHLISAFIYQNCLYYVNSEKAEEGFQYLKDSQEKLPFMDMNPSHKLKLEQKFAMNSITLDF